MYAIVHQPKISAMQLCLLIIASRLAIMTVFLPIVGNHSNAKDAWISAAFSSIIALLITVMIVLLAKRHPNLSLIEICIYLLGSWGGRLISLIYIGFYLQVSYLTVRQFSEIINNALMPETPIPFLNITLTVSVIFAVYRGLESIANVNTIVLPISLASIIIILILLLKDVQFESLLPVLEEGMKPVIVGTIIPIVLYGETILILVLSPYVKDQPKIMSYSLLANVISSIVLILLSIFVVGIFGANEANNLTLPVFSLARMVSVAHFLERIEAVMVAAWISLLFMKAAIYLYAGVISFGQWLALKSYKALIIPLGVLMLILSEESFENIAEIKHFLTPEHYSVYAFSIEIFIPMLLYFISIFKKRKNVDE
ncbi:endospore germination permease [Bacillus sp. FJAT-47783]|uniref:GerAB/ArcD/ProY family transporter n=1 Tax=Bacillus sp. FJAT-47783 TaxID=2922712 RepID=UPI001FAC4644|nr:endospore germination permease [Bacillus sp. FJAT-47783]